MSRRGRFVTFEGGEGAGKSTQLRLLAEVLRTSDVTVVETREPGGTQGAEEIRALFVTGAADRWDPLTELLLVTAARRDHVRNLIEPALARGAWVLCDRFLDSTVAYQGYGHGVSRTLILETHERFVGPVYPDLTVILDVRPEEGLRRGTGAEIRIGGAAEDRFERLADDFHLRLYEGFRAIAAQAPDRCVLIDSTRPRETVAAEVRNLVSERLGARLDD